MTTPDPQTGDTPSGFAYATSAYLIWGFLPLYMKALAHVPAPEVIAHRILWSVPIAGLILIALGRTRDLASALKTPRMVGMAAVTATLISINWGVYVWAIANDRTLDAALGYYMNPLFSVALGAVLLGERLAPAQWIAVGLAAVAVTILTVAAGVLPWVALVLMTSLACMDSSAKRCPSAPTRVSCSRCCCWRPPRWPICCGSALRAISSPRPGRTPPFWSAPEPSPQSR
jgi:chloramphenicol-sensitive protein RarD